MTEAPIPPLVPAEVDLRDFQGMWIDTDRLLRSDTWVLGTGDEKAAAMTARINGRNGNDWREAVRWASAITSRPVQHVLDLLRAASLRGATA